MRDVMRISGVSSVCGWFSTRLQSFSRCMRWGFLMRFMMDALTFMGASSLLAMLGRWRWGIWSIFLEWYLFVGFPWCHLGGTGIAECLDSRGAWNGVFWCSLGWIGSKFVRGSLLTATLGRRSLGGEGIVFVEWFLLWFFVGFGDTRISRRASSSDYDEGSFCSELGEFSAADLDCTLLHLLLLQPEYHTLLDTKKN